MTSYCHASELHRVADLNEQKTSDNAGVFTKGSWNNLQIQLNGSPDPNNVDLAMYGTCNIEMDKSDYAHNVIKAKEGYSIHEYTFNEDACNVKVEILDRKPQEARVTTTDACQSFCGIQGNVHLLDGYYR
jgi:hypothetical protein